MSTQPTDAELDTLLPMVQLNGEKPAQMVWLTRKDARAFSRAVLAKWGQPAQAEEPVAWAATSEDGVVEALGMNQSRRFDTPLYLAPQSVVREPLTDEQIKDLQDDGVFLGSCRQIVRAIEAEHGIKGGQQ